MRVLLAYAFHALNDVSSGAIEEQAVEQHQAARRKTERLKCPRKTSTSNLPEERF
jgi:hypothetical protein